MPSKAVAVVVTLSDQEKLTADEEISLRQVVHFLGQYDKFFVAPDHIRVPREDFGVKRYRRRYFGSAAAHSRLLLSRDFYRTFEDYQYILLYHLDALVLQDRLEEWCAAGFDYIGAPWLPSDDSPWVTVAHVGNGGFSLRNVQSFLKVLESRRLAEDPDLYWTQFAASKPAPIRYANAWRKYLKRMRLFNGVRWQTQRWRRNEDHFWSNCAVRFLPEFKVAPVEEGLRFAFEVAPRRCLELTGGELPFGCHAWPKYDRGFWEPYLVSNGATH